METITLDTRSLGGVLDARDPDRCPHHNLATDVCTAALSVLRTDGPLQAGYCLTENYDNCPMFLAKALRRR